MRKFRGSRSKPSARKSSDPQCIAHLLAIRQREAPHSVISIRFSDRETRPQSQQRCYMSPCFVCPVKERQRVGHVEMADPILRELPPCPLCGPPYEPAPAHNEQAQGNPSINACGNDPRAQREDWYDHRKIIRAGVAAVRAIT